VGTAGGGVTAGEPPRGRRPRSRPSSSAPAPPTERPEASPADCSAGAEVLALFPPFVNGEGVRVGSGLATPERSELGPYLLSRLVPESPLSAADNFPGFILRAKRIVLLVAAVVVVIELSRGAARTVAGAETG
jgi:hypothetical protein